MGSEMCIRDRTFSAFSVWIAFLVVRILLEKGIELVVKLECWSLNWNYGFFSEGFCFFYSGW